MVQLQMLTTKMQQMEELERARQLSPNLAESTNTNTEEKKNFQVKMPPMWRITNVSVTSLRNSLSATRKRLMQPTRLLTPCTMNSLAQRLSNAFIAQTAVIL